MAEMDFLFVFLATLNIDHSPVLVVEVIIIKYNKAKYKWNNCDKQYISIYKQKHKSKTEMKKWVKYSIESN